MLVKESVPINFAQGIQTKVDKKQLAIGKFEDLENSVFTTEGLLDKRYGFQPLQSLSDASNKYITTLNGNLTALGTGVNAYAQGTNTWVNKGSILPMEVSTLSLIRNNLNQTQCDAVVASNGYVCTVYTEINAGVSVYKYAIADSETGQNIVAPTLIPNGSGVVTGSPRVFILGTYFLVVYTNVISGTSHLQYIAITINTPTTVTSPQDIASNYTATPGLSFDGFTVPSLGRFYFAYNQVSGGQKIVAGYLTTAQAGTGTAPTNTVNFSGEQCSLITVTADLTVPAPIIYVNYFDPNLLRTRNFNLNADLTTASAPQSIAIWGSSGLANLASAAQNGICTMVYDVNNTYSYNSSLHTNFIVKQTITAAGSSSATSTNIRSLGLASKAFIIDSNVYYLGVYSVTATDFSLSQSVISSFQPTFFLINATTSTQAAPKIIGKLAYQNSGGYLTTGLPCVTTFGTSAYISHLFKSLVQPVNKNTNAGAGTLTSGVYAQTGINLARLDITVEPITTAETSHSLHISGGFLWQYDGYTPVEHGFFLYPENVECDYVEDQSFSRVATWSPGGRVITVVDASQLIVGMTVFDPLNPTNIPAGTYIIAINGLDLTVSNPLLGTGGTIDIESNIPAQPDGSTNANVYAYQVTYEWTDNQGFIHRSAPSIPTFVTTTGTGEHGKIVIQVPTLRLTYKTSNPIKIAIYRWSVAQQIYYQVTSLTYVIENSTTTDSIMYQDTQPDENIIGNSILYTTGGVLENIAAPATNIMTLFDDRLWIVDAENRNLLWYSKQVIQSTPVEMSDLLTYFVAPNLGTQGNTGPITALSAMDDKLIVFKAQAIYYVNGTGPDVTGANNQYSQPVFITSSVGCDDPNSIVLTPQGIQFRSDKGIWLLGRDLAVKYIGSPVEAYNEAEVLSAISIPETTQIRFTLDSGDTLMYDYYYDQWGKFTGIPGISSCVYEGLHTYLNSAGDVFREDPTSYLDDTTPVLMYFKTSWISLAGLQGFERFYQAFLLGEYFSPFLLDINLKYDYNEVDSDSYTITPDRETVFEARLFPTKQKCETFQLEVQEQYDPTIGPPAGRGLSLSGMNLIIGKKKSYRTSTAAKSFGS